MTLDCLLTRFFVPTWWVRAYERQLAAPMAPEALIDPRSSVILPSLTEIELDALSILINQCQQQMLAGKSPLSLSKSWHDKHVASHKKADLFAFSRMFSLLGGVRLLVSDRDDKAHTVPLFSREVWRRVTKPASGPRSKKAREDGVVQLDPTDLGAMLVLGYGEPYLCRMASSTTAALDNLLEGHGPLSLWRAPWLDFKGVEKLVLLRMERAMQWQLSYLTLSGVFEGDFDELTAGIVSDRLLAKADNSIEVRFEALEKVGKKLADHGYLDWDWDDEFLAFSRGTIGQSLIWKIMDNKGQQDDHRAYRTGSAAYLFEHLFLRHLDSILLALFGIRWQDDPTYQDLRGKIDALLDGPILDDIEVLTILSGNRPLVNGALFIEWLVRLVPEQPLQLPSHLISPEITELLKSVTAENIAAKFKEFTERVSDDPMLLDGLKTDPQLTCALAVAKPKPQVKAQAKTKAPTKAPAKAPAKAQPQPAAQPAAQPQPEPLPRRGASAGPHLKTQAAQHLHSLKTRNFAGYQQLKKRYLASLSATEAQAIKDMQAILTAQHFDDQIKQSLVLYLVRNPTEWQGGEWQGDRQAGGESTAADKQRSAEAILKSLLS